MGSQLLLLSVVMLLLLALRQRGLIYFMVMLRATLATTGRS
jgi:hypothetical protein